MRAALALVLLALAPSCKAGEEASAAPPPQATASSVAAAAAATPPPPTPPVLAAGTCCCRAERKAELLVQVTSLETCEKLGGQCTGTEACWVPDPPAVSGN